MNKLKVGLIVDDNEHSEMVKYLLKASIESKNFSIETFIVQKTFRTQKSLLKRSYGRMLYDRASIFRIKWEILLK